MTKQWVKDVKESLRRKRIHRFTRREAHPVMLPGSNSDATKVNAVLEIHRHGREIHKPPPCPKCADKGCYKCKKGDYRYVPWR